MRSNEKHLHTIYFSTDTLILASSLLKILYTFNMLIEILWQYLMLPKKKRQQNKTHRTESYFTHLHIFGDIKLKFNIKP